MTSSEVGIAIITTTALRHERRKNSMTMPVKTIASTSVRNDARELLLRVGRLDVQDGELDVGILRCELRAARAARACDASTSLVLAAFWTSSVDRRLRRVEYA